MGCLASLVEQIGDTVNEAGAATGRVRLTDLPLQIGSHVGGMSQTEVRAGRVDDGNGGEGAQHRLRLMETLLDTAVVLLVLLNTEVLHITRHYQNDVFVCPSGLDNEISHISEIGYPHIRISVKKDTLYIREIGYLTYQ